MPRGLGGQDRPMRLALCLCLALFLLIFASLFGPRVTFYYRCWKQDLPRDLWARLLQRHTQGWQLDTWSWTAGPGPGQKSYLVLFRRPLEQFADGLYQTEFRWPTPSGWATWTEDETPYGLPWSEPRWLDLTRDAKPELVLHFFNSGNCLTCGRERIFLVRGNRLVSLELGLNEHQAVQQIKDLDGDGQPELLVTGAELEFFGDRSHEAALTYTRVYRWDREAAQFRDVSTQFPDYYADQLRVALDRSNELYLKPDERDFVATAFFKEAFRVSRNLAARALHDWCLGQPERAWKEYEQKLADQIDLVQAAGSLGILPHEDAFAHLLAERKQLSQLFFGRELPWAAATPPVLIPITARRDPPSVTR